MPSFVVALLNLYRPHLLSGQGLVEYALVLVVVAGAAAVAMTLLGDALGSALGDITALAGPGDGAITGAASPSHSGTATGAGLADQLGGQRRHGQGWLNHFGPAGPPRKP